MRNQFLLLTFLLACATSVAATLPYDASADAKADVKHALAAAKVKNQPVLVIMGANWCEDCVVLDRSMHTGKNAALVAKAFKVVKVDVGNFNRNLDLDAEYGHPIKNGIPAAVVLSPDNKVLYTTEAGELADARRMSDTGVYDFFKRISETSATKR